MKANQSPSRLGLLVAGVAVLFLSFWGGGSWGRAAGEKQTRAAAKNPTVTRQDSISNRGGESGDLTNFSISGRDAASRLKALWESSVNPQFDFELLDKTKILLDGMSSREIGELLATLSPSWYPLRSNIICYWAQRDGPAALGFIDGSPFDRMIRARAFSGWMSQDPDTALAWARENKSSLESRLLIQYGLKKLAKSDPDQVFQEISHMAPDEARLMLLVMVFDPGNEAMHKRILEAAAATGRPEDLTEIRNTLVTELARKDPAEVAALTESMETDAAESREIEAAMVKAKADFDQESVMAPQSALDSWLERFADTGPIPKEITDTVGLWSIADPKAAKEWLGTLTDPSQRETLRNGGFKVLLANSHYAEASKFANLLETPELRRAALRNVSGLWSLANPAQEAEWRSSLSPGDRALMGGGK